MESVEWSASRRRLHKSNDFAETLLSLAPSMAQLEIQISRVNARSSYLCSILCETGKIAAAIISQPRFWDESNTAK